MIVRFEAGADRADRRRARAEAGAQEFTSLGRGFQLLGLQSGQDAGESVEQLKANPDVADAARDGYSVLHAAPDDTYFSELWGLDNTGLNIGGVATSTRAPTSMR